MGADTRSHASFQLCLSEYKFELLIFAVNSATMLILKTKTETQHVRISDAGQRVENRNKEKEKEEPDKS